MTWHAPADVFSLGATVYAMVCSSFPKMLALHLGKGGPLDWPSTADAMPDWKPLCERMLRVEEDERIGMDELGQIAARSRQDFKLLRNELMSLLTDRGRLSKVQQYVLLQRARIHELYDVRREREAMGQWVASYLHPRRGSNPGPAARCSSSPVCARHRAAMMPGITCG